MTLLNMRMKPQKTYILAYMSWKKLPYLGRYVPELPDKHLRELIYKKYRIVYDISEDSKTVYIHFVVHGSRSFKSFYNSYIKNNF